MVQEAFPLFNSRPDSLSSSSSTTTVCRLVEQKSVLSTESELTYLPAGQSALGQCLVHQLLRLARRERLGHGAHGHVAVHRSRHPQTLPTARRKREGEIMWESRKFLNAVEPVGKVET